MASLDEIAQLGHVEKEAAKRAELHRPEGSYRLGFLEGVLWERTRAEAARRTANARTFTCPHGHVLADLRDGTATCFRGCR